MAPGSNAHDRQRWCYGGGQPSLEESSPWNHDDAAGPQERGGDEGKGDEERCAEATKKVKAEKAQGLDESRRARNSLVRMRTPSFVTVNLTNLPVPTAAGGVEKGERREKGRRRNRGLHVRRKEL